MLKKNSQRHFLFITLVAFCVISSMLILVNKVHALSVETTEFGVLQYNDIELLTTINNAFNLGGQNKITKNIGGKDYSFSIVILSGSQSGTIQAYQPYGNQYKFTKTIGLDLVSNLNGGEYRENFIVDANISTVDMGTSSFEVYQTTLYQELNAIQAVLLVFEVGSGDGHPVMDEVFIQFYPDANTTCPDGDPCGVPSPGFGLDSWKSAYYRLNVEPRIALMGSLILNQIRFVGGEFMTQLDDISTASKTLSLFTTNPYDMINIATTADQYMFDEIDRDLESSNIKVEGNAKAVETVLNGILSAGTFAYQVKTGNIVGATLTFGNSISSSFASAISSGITINSINVLAKKINNIIVARKMLYNKYYLGYNEDEIYELYGLVRNQDTFYDLIEEVSSREELFPVGDYCDINDFNLLNKVSTFGSVVNAASSLSLTCQLSNYYVDDVDLDIVNSIYDNFDNTFINWSIASSKAADTIFNDVDNDGYENIYDLAPNNYLAPGPSTVNQAPVAQIYGGLPSVAVNSLVTLNGSTSYDPDGEGISSYGWQLLSKPGGSNSSLSSTTGSAVNFTPDIEGAYTIELSVSDGSLSSSVRKNVVASYVYDTSPVLLPEQKIIGPISGGANSSRYYYINVPDSEITKIIVWMYGSSKASAGPADVYVSYNKNPTVAFTHPYDPTAPVVSYQYGDPNDLAREQFDIVNPKVGKYHVLLYGFMEPYSNVNLFYQFERGVPDADADGVPDLNDDFLNDPAASLDTDNDGFPDAWNSGKSAAHSTTGLRLDAFPSDPAAAVDTDGDGYPDFWNPGKAQADSTTGLSLDLAAFVNDSTEWADSDTDGIGDNADKFVDDPAASLDTDGDGFPDSWNPGKTAADSTTGLVLDKFPNDPAASRDSDDDNYPDMWNAGYTAAMSTHGLMIDRFPFDGTEWSDSDFDGVGDNADAFVHDSAEWLDSDGDEVGDNADPAPYDPTRSTNIPPEIIAVPDISLQLGETADILIIYSDQDNDQVSLQVLNGPDFANLSGEILTLTPETNALGQHSISVKASDGFKGSAYLTIYVEVTEAQATLHFPAPTETLLTASYNGEALVDSNLPGQTRLSVVGDELAVFDPDGVLCGRTQITVAGEFGPLLVYGDDPATPEVDEGASEGDVLTVRLWDSQRQMELPVRSLQLNGQRQTLTWSDGGGGTMTLQGLAQDHISVFRPSTVRWYADADGSGTWGGLDYALSGFGLGSDRVAAGDWNGDGLTDPGVFREKGAFGWWYFDSNGSGVWETGIDQALQFGLGTDAPVVGDWNGDGQSDFGVFRAKGDFGWWYFDSNGNRRWDSGIDQALQFGLASDIPIVGDWNGDGQSDFGAVRYKNGQAWWYFDSNGNRQWDSGVDQSLQFGLEGDIPVVGDWNGDGLSDFGVMRNGIWYLDGNGNRRWDSGVDLVYPAYGLPGDQPLGGVWR